MRNSLFLKIFIIGFVLLLIVIPLTMIGAIVQERQTRQNEAVRDIGASYAGTQRLLGPVLVMPYSEFYTVDEITTDVDGKKIKQPVEHRVEHARHVLPGDLVMQGELATHIKKRGIFRAPVYEWQANISGNFLVPEAVASERHRTDSRILWGQPYVALGLSDMRGVTGKPELDWGGKPVGFVKGGGIGVSDSGMIAPITPPADGKPASITFKLKLGLRGTERLSIVPLGENNRIQINSAWPHPSFGGRFLPDAASQSIGPEGFRATWNISSLASAAGQQFLRAAGSSEGKCADASCLEAIELRLVEPVNIYTQSDRALKYGFLFVGITFAAFFLFEIMRRLRIHPAQYFMVGLAQALFFLLVLSLSEHIAFSLAYLAAASASVGLIGFYLAFVMQSARRGIVFGGVLGLLFAALYGLLVSEDIALMLGSLLLFGLLATAMILTRRFDWYRLGNQSEGATASPQ
ncbi:MAG: inner rane CreD family protein [Proteobacteria bacterium]|nr:inner rane CreD family protein [Pseudomonadota bacterium]